MHQIKLKQYLPKYKENFKIYPHWIIKESRHYEFYYFPKSAAEKEIEKIINRQEKAFKKIVKFLKIKPPSKKIKYYFYPTRKVKSHLMGDSWYAQAIYNDFAIHVLYTYKIQPIGEHEDAHLLSLPWGLSIGFFQEGLAEYLAGYNWYGQKHNGVAFNAYAKKIIPHFSSLFTHKNWANLKDRDALFYYCFAGSITGFLIKKFGFNKFKKLYQSLDRKNSLRQNTKIFQKIYNSTPQEIEQTWIQKIKQR